MERFRAMSDQPSSQYTSVGGMDHRAHISAAAGHSFLSEHAKSPTNDPLGPGTSYAGGLGCNVASNSTAVLSAIRTLQDKIRVLDDEKALLQEQLRAAREGKERESVQHRTLERQLQLQLQESVRSLSVRNEAEVDAMKQHSARIQMDLEAALQSCNRDLSSTRAENQALRERVAKAEEELASQFNENASARRALADGEKSSVAYEQMCAQLTQQLKSVQEDFARRKKDFDKMEEEAMRAQHFKSVTEERSSVLAQNYERAQAELEALRRQATQTRDELRESESRHARAADELAAALADKMTLEGEKRQLEESLRNVLVINDQLLQKMYDVTVGGGGVGLHAAFVDPQGAATSIFNATKNAGKKKKKKPDAGASARPPHNFERSTVASRTKMHTGESFLHTYPYPLNSTAARPWSASAAASSRHTHANATTRSGASRSTHAQGHGEASLVRLPTEDVKTLENELHEEIRQLRRQYREICTQVENGGSVFETEQLNVALTSVVEKLEKKGRQLQLVERMDADLATAQHWLG